MPKSVKKSGDVWDDTYEFKRDCVDAAGQSPYNSKVIDPNNPDTKQRNVPAKNFTQSWQSEVPLAPVISGTFDPEKGYIVEGEDEKILAASGMNEGQRKKALERRAKAMSDEELERYIFRHNLSHMGEAERDAYMRFSDLGL